MKIFKENDRINDYIILKQIGEGGYGITYLAKKDEKQYVLKQTSLNSIGNKDEKEISNYIKDNLSENNNNLIFYKEYFDFPKDGISFFVSEYIGVSLRGYLLDHPEPWKIEEIINFAKQILDSLYLLHSNSIYHRDIKPDNICIKYNNEKEQTKTYVIIDYGSGKKIEKGEKDTLNRKDYKNFEFGTWNYLHPKINEIKYCGMENELDNKSIDIWSLGLVCLELFTGKKLFQYNNQKENNKKLANEKYYLIPFYEDKTTVELVEFFDSMLQYSNEQLDTYKLLGLDFMKNNPQNFNSFPIDKEKNEENYIKEGDQEYIKLNFRKGLNFDYDKLLNKKNKNKKCVSKEELIRELSNKFFEEELFTEPVYIPLIADEDELE